VIQTDLVERIWARDATVWTGADEAQWLGWLDEPARMLERVHGLVELASSLEYERVVLLGMGGSSLAPEVMRRTFEIDALDVLDTTHPGAIRRLADALDLDQTLFVVSSKSGGTLETRSHFEYFWERTGEKADRFLVVTDPGSALETVAQERGVPVVAGEPTIGGRYSALSPFGIVPAVLVGVDAERLLLRAQEMADACRGAEGNEGLELGLQLGEGWREGRDKACVNPDVGGFGLWAEQLIAESTGKQGKGLVPAPGESPEGPDRQAVEVRIPSPYELGQEFFRWEFATAVAGSILGINPFDQPDVQAAKDRTSAVLDSGRDPELEPDGSLDDLLAQAEAGKAYVCIQAFVDPAREAELDGLVARARETGCVVTKGLGPRYLHSTGQLHKGGPNTGLFVQVVDETGDELPIPGQPFGFGRLIRAQAAGDYESLKERGRRAARVRLEDL
jgi:transaldolase / glucose-6-phosphate isomerase